MRFDIDNITHKYNLSRTHIIEIICMTLSDYASNMTLNYCICNYYDDIDIFTIEWFNTHKGKYMEASPHIISKIHMPTLTDILERNFLFYEKLEIMFDMKKLVHRIVTGTIEEVHKTHLMVALTTMNNTSVPILAKCTKWQQPVCERRYYKKGIVLEFLVSKLLVKKLTRTEQLCIYVGRTSRVLVQRTLEHLMYKNDINGIHARVVHRIAGAKSLIYTNKPIPKRILEELSQKYQEYIEVEIRDHHYGNYDRY